MPSALTSVAPATVEFTWSFPNGTIVPIPTFPSDFIAKAGVLNVVPAAAVEGVISNKLLAVYCAPANQL